MTQMQPVGRLRLRGYARLVVAVVALATVAAAAWFSSRVAQDIVDPKRKLTISYFQELGAGDSAAGYAFEGLRDVTEQTCPQTDECVEAAQSDRASFYRFSDPARAEAFAASLEDAYASDRIVIDFSRHVWSSSGREQAKRALDETWSSD